jgi:hypothetical protein
MNTSADRGGRVKKWLDEAQEKAAEAKDKAQAEAGKAIAKAVVDEAGRRVSATLEGWLDSAESALEEATQEAEGRREGLELPTGDADAVASELEEVVEEATGPTPEELAEAAAAELQRMKEERAALAAQVHTPGDEVHTPGEVHTVDEAHAVVEAPEEEVVVVPQEPELEPEWTPPPPRDVFAEAEETLRRAAEARGGEPVTADAPLTPDRADPFAAAEAALAKARAARVSSGTARADEPEPAPLPRSGRGDPLSSAEAVLAKAAEARETAMRGGRRAAAREAEARRTLERMKAGRGAAPTPEPAGSDEDDTPAGLPKPRKRTL